MDEGGNNLGELAAAVTGGGLVTAVLLQFKQIGELFRGWRDGRAAHKRDAAEAAGTVVDAADRSVDLMAKVMARVEERLKADREECQREIVREVAKAVAPLNAEIAKLRHTVGNLEQICVALAAGKRLTVKQAAMLADIRKRVAAKMADA